MYRHPYFVQLQHELDSLGYPEFPRRVAIADGSSNVTRPLGLEMENGEIVNTCLMDLEWMLFVKPFPYVRMKITTGEQGSDEEIFRARYRIAGVPVPGFSETVIKNYPKAEYAAPGSYERFYRGIFLPLAKLSMSKHFKDCIRDDYRVPFVPTTSVFDIRTDNSSDFSYPIADSLFFSEPNQMNLIGDFGYPHLNGLILNARQVLPFDACFATPQNSFHVQNPVTQLSDFIFEEVVNGARFIQNTEFQGSLAEIYSAEYSSSQTIQLGSNVTNTKRTGPVIFNEFSSSRILSPRVRLEHGVVLSKNSRVEVGNLDDQVIECFQFQENWSAKRSVYDFSKINYIEFTQEKTPLLEVFPNPSNGTFRLVMNDDPNAPRQYMVFDLGGRLLSRGEITKSSSEIQLRLAAGSYVLKVFNRDMNSTTQILIQ
jgi:hypothetical protein